MATVTSLGFSIFSRYDGSGVRRARNDLRRMAAEQRIMTDDAVRMTRAVATFGPVAIPVFAGVAAATAKATVAFGAAAMGVGLWGLAMRNFVRRSSTAQAQLKTLKAAVNNFGLSASKTLGKTFTLATSAAVIALRKLEPVVRAVAPVMLKIARDLHNFASGPGMTKFSKWLAVQAPAAIAAMWQATKNLGSGLLTLGQRLGVFDTSGFNQWLVRVTANFKRWANGPEVPRLKMFLDQAGPLTYKLAANLLLLAKNIMVALGPMAVLVLRALVPFVGWLAKMAAEHPNVVRAIWALILANRVLNAALLICNSAIIRLLWTLGKMAVGMAVAAGRIVAYRMSVLAAAVASRVHAAAALASAAAHRVMALAATLVSAAFWRQVGATIAAGAAHVTMAARMAVSRAASLASAAASAVLSGSLFRTVGAALAAGAAQVAMGARMLAGRVAMFASAAASAVLSGSLFRTVGAALVAGAAQVAMGARMFVARAAMFATAAASAILNVSLYRTVAATIAAGAAAAVSGARMAIMRGVTLAWAAAQWVLNAALLANPYVIIALAIIALVAAIVLAYKRSETFRNIVQAAFRAVAAAGSWMWNTVLKPAFQGIATAAGWVWGAIKTAFGFIGTIFRGVGAAAMWLWRNAISPVFRAIGTLAGWLWQVIKFNFAVMVVLFRTVGVAVQWLWNNAVSPLFRAIGRLAVWLWNNAIGPAFRGIGRVVMWLGNTIFRPIFNAVIAPVMRALGRVAMWLWNNAIGPAFRAIGRVAMWLWNNAIKPAFTFIRNIFRALGQAANYLMNSNVNAFQLIARAASWLWARIRGTFALIGGVFVKVANGLVSAWNWAWSRVRAILNFAWGHIRSTFGTIRGWIGSAWDWVANKIRGAWNWAWSAVRNIMSFAWARIRGTFNTIRGWVGSAWDWVANKLRGAWNWAWSNIRNIMSFAWARIRGTFNTIRGWVGSAWDWVANKLRGAWNWAWSNIRNIMSFAWSRIRSTFNTIRGWIGSAWDWVANKLRNAWNWAWNRVRDILNFAWSRIRGTFNTIRGWISGAWDWVANKLRNAWNWAWNRVRDILNFAWSKIRGTFNTLRGWISSLWSRLTGWMASVWNWAWRRFREILNFGWSKIRGTFNVIKGWLSGAWSWIANNSVNAWNWLWNRVRDIFNWTWGKLRGSINAMKRWIHSAFDQIVRGAGRIWEGLKSFVGRPINFVIGFVADRLIPFANKALSMVLGKKAPQINAGALKGFKIPGVATGGVISRSGGVERGYAAGGVLKGYSPGKDNMIGMLRGKAPIGLSGGEGILRPEVMRTPGMTEFLHAANRKARLGGISGVKNMMQHTRASVMPYGAGDRHQNNDEVLRRVGYGYAKGGIVGGVQTAANFDIGGALSGIVNKLVKFTPIGAAKWGKDQIAEKGFNILIDKVLGKIYNNLLSWMGMTGPVGALIGGVMEKVVSTIVNWVVDKTSGGGGSASSVVAAAQKYIGKGDRGGRDNNMNQFNDEWGMPGAPWCANFVSTCIKDANAGKYYPGYPTAAVYGYWSKMKHVPWSQAQPGDLRSTGSSTHINIVEKKMGSGLGTIGGNQGPKVNRRVDHSGTILRPKAGAPSGGGGAGGGGGKGLASYGGTGAGGAGGGGRAYFTHFWDDWALTASGSRMTKDTIASSYIPLGSELTVSKQGKSARGVIRDLGPAKFVYQRHPGIAVLDLNKYMLPGDGYGNFKITKVGKGRTLYGKRLRGYEQGGSMSPGELALVGERGPEVYQAGGSKGGQVYRTGTSVTSHGDTHVHFHGSVYVKNKREFQDMVVTAIEEAQRKKKL